MTKSSPKFAIGIDLGTTNSSLAFIPLHESEESLRLLSIPQWENEDLKIEDERLPSHLWVLPKSFQKKSFAQSLMGENQSYIVGRLARGRALEEPLDVIHSAKSWLSIGKSEQRTSRILPWGSPNERMSPLEASTAFLKHLKDAWNLRNPSDPLHEQKVVITVPASFDELAQRLTLEAAKLAGIFDVELIEEPIAAFYDGQSHAVGLSESAARILVCDIGGGTADFSLLHITSEKAERIKVSEHLLLGGDNIDLSLTLRIAQRLSSDELPRAAYNLLSAQVRKLKESALSSSKDESFHLSIPLNPKNLFGTYLSAEIRADEIRQWILEDFFPIVSKDSQVVRSQGLAEWGLPYAKDSRLSAHLAEFLSGATIDALLCVGGTLIPELLQERILKTLQSWQSAPIKKLAIDSSDLAIARGAARFAYQRANVSTKKLIHSPYPRDLFMEVESLGEVKLIPKGHPRMEPFAVALKGLHLRLGEDVRFQLHSVSPRGERESLPPLILKLSGQKKKGSIPVELTSVVRETGVLEVQCTTEAGIFTLDFALDLKDQRTESGLGSPLDFSLVPRISAAHEAIRKVFHKTSGLQEKPERLTNTLEEIFGLPREEWSANHLRGLWPALESVMFQRNLSPEHETIFFYLAGFALRPGFGYQGDSDRIQALVKVYDESFRRVEQNQKLLIHWWILWRRVSGGLHASFQQKIFDRYMPQIRKEKDPPVELIRLLGSLERLDTTSKIQLGRQMLNQLKVSRTSPDLRIWSLARLANRFPVYAPASSVLAPSQVEEWADELLALNLPLKAKASLFFAWAGRMRGDKRYDIDPAYRDLFLEQIKDPEEAQAVREVTLVDDTTQSELLSDSLPPGFVFVAKQK